MLNALNFNTRKTPLFIVSDPHFNHDKEFLYVPRGFTNIGDHDVEIKRRWNETVAPNDNVLHLGDHIFRDGDGTLAEKTFEELNGHIYMLWGNHNSGVKAVYKRLLAESGFAAYGNIEVYPLTWKNKVTFLGNYVLGSIDRVPYVASHFPYRIWDEMQHGAIALSGHSHSSDLGSNPDALEGKRLDCGIDNFGRPVAFDEVMQIMDKKQMIVFDHHNNKTVSGR